MSHKITTYIGQSTGGNYVSVLHVAHAHGSKLLSAKRKKSDPQGR